MLPTTPKPAGRRQPQLHESINDLPVHPHTRAQIFHPAPESRHFTRADAARAFFSSARLPRSPVPHPGPHTTTAADDSPNAPGPKEPLRGRPQGPLPSDERGLLPADARVPHADLVVLARDRLAHPAASDAEHAARVAAYVSRKTAALDAAAAGERARAEEARTVVRGRRWDFRFVEARVEDVGRRGVSREGVGWRYGAPLLDRKRGQFKLPKAVDV